MHCFSCEMEGECRGEKGQNADLYGWVVEDGKFGSRLFVAIAVGKLFSYGAISYGDCYCSCYD